MKFKCIKSFNIPRVDDDWDHTEEEMQIKKHSIWRLEERSSPRIADVSGISLENEEGHWIEIYPEDLKDYFETLEESK